MIKRLAALLLLLCLGVAYAQGSVVPTKPTWANLKTEQKTALAPLENKWQTLPSAQKKKWLKLSESYNKLSNDEQAKLHERMRDWVKLTPEQRAQARLNFAGTKELTAGEKQQKWKEYQALTKDERQQLRTEAKKETPKSAATATRPQTKLTNTLSQ